MSEKVSRSQIDILDEFVVVGNELHQFAADNMQQMSSPCISPVGSIRRLESFEELRQQCADFESTFDNEQNRIQGSYLGIVTELESELESLKPGQFAVYHRIPKSLVSRLCSSRLSSTDQLDPPPFLYLNIVYKDTNGRFRHYPINEITDKSAPGQKLYQVSVDPENTIKVPTSEPTFRTVEQLLDHYTKFAYGYKFDKKGGLEIEVFPT